MKTIYLVYVNLVILLILAILLTSVYGAMTILLIISSVLIVFWILIRNQAKLLEKTKNEFVAITAHELRTPITIISGSAERLLKIMSEQHINNNNISDMVANIHEESGRLLKIINTLQDLTALEEGKVFFKKEKIDPAALIQETIEELAIKAKKKNLSLAFTPPSSPFWALADEEWARQILVNIISNAIQYTKEGGIIITLEQRGSFIKTVVTDTGIGIPPKKQKSLFQKFQADGKHFLRSKEYGNGMGLYISKMLVKSMGGVILLEKSEAGRGSTFSFTLPIAS